MYYVYMAKLNDIPIYVGKGTKNRYRHCYRKFIGCTVEILEYFENSDDAFKKEEELIKLYGRKDLNEGTLLNKSNGGKYIKGSIPWLGQKLSEEHRDSIAKGIKNHYKQNPIDPNDRKGEKNNFHGRKHSEETKRAIAAKKKGSISSFKGKKHTKEAIEKNRLAHLGKVSPKKINFDIDLVEKLKYEQNYTIKQLCDFFNCSAFPIKKVLKEIRER